MERKYVPRRAGKRWLTGAPEYVLDCIFDKASDSFDVLFTGSLLGTIAGEPQDFGHVYVMGLDLSREGSWSSFELDAYQAVEYRRRHAHHRVKWSGLPSAVRNAVTCWANE